MPSLRKKDDIPINGEDITPAKDGCLYKEIVHESTDDEAPWFDDKVTIHYIGTLADGTVFANTREKDEKVSFNLGRGEVIKAWDMAVATMKRGEIAKFFSKPKYAYGLKGIPGKVESATSVIFEIELIDCIGKDISDDRDGTILRRVIKKGDAYEPTNEDSVVEVMIKGTYNKGEVFDERTVTFYAGAGAVQNIPAAVERSVFRMTKGQHDRLRLTGKAIEDLKKYNVPSDATVEYDVTITKLERAKEERQLSDDDKLETADVLKQRADEFVKAGFYDLAIKRYKTAFHYLLNASLTSEVDRNRSWNLKFHSQSNLALCYLKVGNYADCRRSCETALAHDKKHEKSLFRLGQCRLATHNYDQAIKDFEAVLEVNPDNELAKKLIEECIRKKKVSEIDEGKMFSPFFKKPDKKNAPAKIEEYVSSDEDKDA
ncbi:unnamed protein product [Adineta steineri]|uniref:peptidylprolyl isomerase n=1 Tax=Adineta steineri TaxID=433720 RepID=A0A814ATN3_9BILA|nr:unnamed protein product [Adineta steineri]CAF0918843.1 unnamed protein product [Adineta steineri]CAF3714913.1 unnamed protein product [Adineta steineri]